MGTRITVGGVELYASSYSVSEDSTPTSSDDSSGSVGQFNVSAVGIDDPLLLNGSEVRLVDSLRGSTIGFVTRVDESDRGSVLLVCQSRLGRLNVYNIQAQPFSGTLGDAFRYYASLAGQQTDVLVDDQIENVPVVFQGWSGELWFTLKQMVASLDCEVALVSDVIYLRPTNMRIATDERNTERSRTHGGTQTAQSVEVYYYNNHAISGKLVYPPGGWTPETEVITVGAGETVERIIEMSASVSSINPPQMQEFVSQGFDSASVYTVVGDDGLPIVPAQWKDAGGSVSVEVNENTTSLTVRMTGATGIRGTRGDYLSTFSLALGSDYTGNRYSTLRIVGSGVAFDRKMISVATGLTDQQTGTDVGATIDNRFISTIDQAYNAGTKAAYTYSGESISLTGEATSINKLGESGEATYPTWEFDAAQNAGLTWQQNEDVHAGKSWMDVQDEYYDLVRNNFENQVFGNAGGARVYDRASHRWYRIRSVSINRSTVQFDADDDLRWEDQIESREGMTWQQDQDLFPGDTWSTRMRRGIRT